MSKVVPSVLTTLGWNMNLRFAVQAVSESQPTFAIGVIVQPLTDVAVKSSRYTTPPRSAMYAYLARPLEFTTVASPMTLRGAPPVNGATVGNCATMWPSVPSITYTRLPLVEPVQLLLAPPVPVSVSSQVS